MSNLYKTQEMKPNHFYLVKTIIESTNRQDTPDLSKLSHKQIRQLLKIASSNRVLFVLCKKIKEYEYLKLDSQVSSLVDKIIIKGEEISQDYSILLKKVKRQFKESNISFIIVKTDRKVDYILSDIDILVGEKEFNKARELLAEVAIDTDIKAKEGRWHYKFAHQAQIDLHKTGFDWYSGNFIDTGSIWDNIEKREFLGDVYNFPSAQNEWIFNALNIIYEKFSLTYLDFVFFTKNKGVDFSEINKIAIRYGWAGGLRVLNTYLNKLEKEIKSAKSKNTISLPRMFSNIDFLRIFIPRLFSPFRNYRSSLYYFCYFFYCKVRFILTKKSRIPFYGNWFNEI